MSGWRGKNHRGGSSSSYNQHANRLRDKLESRNATEDADQNRTTDRPPAGLRGRDLGMWYAQRSKKSTENKLVSKAKCSELNVNLSFELFVAFWSECLVG